ncbi:hypothetical protein CK203_039205 [Vitis vinifera]|uniref:Uncharacterized protein n=1 Tax=Vitis vinifera TaxID=29760 RepID=A0A438H739_VITVI|nr:hypothetical protein CK203_039205 [Vitis vinifera]
MQIAKPLGECSQWSGQVWSGLVRSIGNKACHMWSIESGESGDNTIDYPRGIHACSTPSPGWGEVGWWTPPPPITLTPPSTAPSSSSTSWVVASTTSLAPLHPLRRLLNLRPLRRLFPLLQPLPALRFRHCRQCHPQNQSRTALGGARSYHDVVPPVGEEGIIHIVVMEHLQYGGHHQQTHSLHSELQPERGCVRERWYLHWVHVLHVHRHRSHAGGSCTRAAWFGTTTAIVPTSSTPMCRRRPSRF